MDSARLSPQAARQLRGLLLAYSYVNQRNRRRPLTSTTVLGTMKIEGWQQFEKADVLAMLEDLRDRGYLRLQQMKGEGGYLYYFDIQITPEGSSVIEGYKSDPAVATE